MTQDLWRRSAVELAAMIRAREVSCVEVTDSVLGRIARHNGRINASSPSAARTRCALPSRRTGRSPAAPRPVHGVPVTIKEIDVAGQATTNGLPAYADVIAPDHSPVTRNLRAGAIVVGRTNTPELSMRGHGQPAARPHPQPLGRRHRRAALPAARLRRRRWASGRSTTATTSAARSLPLLRLRPGDEADARPGARERLPSAALAQLMSVQGAICREVRDVRLATRALAEIRAIRGGCRPSTGPRSIRPSGSRSRQRPTTIRSMRRFSPIRAADVLSDAGYAVERVATPSIMKPAQAWFDVLASEIVHFLGPIAREHGSETVQTIFGTTSAWGCRCGRIPRRHRRRTALTRSGTLDRYPLVLCPFLMRSMYPWTTTRKASSR